MEHISKPNLDWSNLKTIIAYQERVAIGVKKLESLKNDLVNETNAEKCKLLTTKLFNELSSLMLNSVSKVKNEFECLKRKRKRKIGELKFKSWWDKNFQELYYNVVLTYIRYRDSGFSADYKSKYKEAKKMFRNKKRLNIKLKRNKKLEMLNKLFKLNKNEFWTKVKLLQRKRHKINIKIDDLKIEYEKLFTVSNNILGRKSNDKLEKLEDFMEVNKNKRYDYVLETKVLKDIVNRLPNGKSSGFNDVNYEMIKYSNSEAIIEMIRIVYEKMIKFQVVPYLFNVSVIKPLVKDSKKLSNDINNLRPVSISDPFANIYEAILLREIESEYKDNNKQFGFKSFSSCSHAIFTLKQSIIKSECDKRRLYVAAIDASKAFDKVRRELLWCKLVEIKIKPLIISGLMNYYSCSNMLVSNNNQFSSIFKTTVGVKQGGVISPKLFSIYIDDLIKDIEKFKHGVNFGKVKADIVAYADDILLISQTKAGLREQLDYVSQYGLENDIKFNRGGTI
ncbi:unnamed protein product [Brachionus calyciflorus]|uniref:Reverse transcriptase domain-containing protein n=1 Tax=Brachionus calyciflorus TaxID=104777 RepID=A0A814IMT6_9BILA|nr:unnamed protein product [Brachionus calyciflorus]